MNRCQFCNHAFLCDDCHTNFFDDSDPIESTTVTHRRTFVGSGEDVDISRVETSTQEHVQIPDWSHNYEGGPSTRNRAQYS